MGLGLRESPRCDGILFGGLQLDLQFISVVICAVLVVLLEGSC